MAHSLLFVDDDASLLHSIRTFFVARGFAVDCATELEEAQALLDCREYALVICDVSLRGTGDEDGLEIVSYLRGSAPRTRIVILTGTVSPTPRDLLRAGFVAHVVTKPLPLADLANILEAMLTENPHAQSS